MERTTRIRRRAAAARVLTAAAVALAAGTLHAAPFYDNFDRTDTTDMSPAWFEQHGDWSVAGGTARSAAGDSGTCCSLMTVDGFADAQPTVQVRVDYDGEPRATYVALVLLYLDNETNVFVKVQDGYAGSAPDGLFDTVYFYTGNNGGTGGAGYNTWVSGEPVWNDLYPYFSSATLTAWVEDDTVHLAVDRNMDGYPDPADTDLDGVADAFCYSRGGLPPEGFGEGVGLGGYNAAWCDDFTALPEPATLALVGGAAVGLALRRRKTM